MDATESFEITPRRRLKATLARLLIAAGQNFETAAVDAAELTLEGMAGDLHCGATRRSGGREPWYERGTVMRNERQLSIVAADELALAAGQMGLAAIEPEWVGANLVLEGVPHLSMLPSGTLLFFAGGATVKIDGQNAPCRLAGGLVAKRAGMADVAAGALAFPKAARRLRGLVGWVEKPGRVARGEAVELRLPEQWIYP